MDKDTKVSVIIPVLEINEYITDKNLPALSKQTFKDFEVLVLPNKRPSESKELEKKYNFLKIIPTGDITRPAEKRDFGAGKAGGEILAFIDDDAFPTPTWLKKAVDIFESKNVAAVCGPGILPKESGAWEKAFDEVLKTWVGSGGLSYRFKKEAPRYVDDYATMNFLIKRNTFEKVGGFDNDYWPGEDSKLCEDVVYKLGEKIYYHPEVCVHHHRRNDLSSYLKQHGQYGFHRGAFFGHGDKNSTRWFYFIPTLFVLYLTSIPIMNLLNTKYQILNALYITPFLLYLVFLTYLFFTALQNTLNILVAVRAPLVLFLMHITYGVNFIKGFLKRKNPYG